MSLIKTHNFEYRKPMEMESTTHKNTTAVADSDRVSANHPIHFESKLYIYIKKKHSKSNAAEE